MLQGCRLAFKKLLERKKSFSHFLVLKNLIPVLAKIEQNYYFSQNSKINLSIF